MLYTHTQQHAILNTLTTSLHSVFVGLNTILVSRRPTLKGVARLTRFEIALLPFVSFKYSHHQWPDLKHLERNWEIHFHHHQGQTSSSTHVIQCRVRIRPGYLIKRVRPTRSRQNVTRLTLMTQMTQPGFNPGVCVYVCVYVCMCLCVCVHF